MSVIELVSNDTRASDDYIGEAEFSRRNETLKVMARNAGLRLPDTRLPEGTALLEIGESSKRALAQRVEAMPTLGEAVAALRSRIQDERPLDYKGVPAQTVRMTADTGRLYADGKNTDNALSYTRNGFAQVAAFVKPDSVRTGFAENMLALPASLRADVFNYHAKSHPRDTSLALRTLLNPETGKRYIRAITSARHSLETGDDGAVADVLADKAGALKGAKARITREPDRSEFELVWPMMARQLVVGDIALGGVRITNSETKAGALKVEAFLLRVLCYNFTTAETFDTNAEELTVRHIGDLTSKLPAMFEKALRRIDPFVKAFGDAYKIALPATRGEVLAKVQRIHSLPESTMTLAAQLWDADGEKSAGDTLAGLVNALTRASQQADIATAGDIERAAGRIAVSGIAA